MDGLYIALGLCVVIGLISLITYFKSEGLRRYKMRFILCGSFWVQALFVLFFDLEVIRFLVNTPEGQMSFGYVFWGLKDAYIIGLVGYVIALLMNARKSNFEFSIGFTFAQFLTAIMIFLVVFYIFLEFQKITDKVRQYTR